MAFLFVTSRLAWILFRRLARCRSALSFITFLDWLIECSEAAAAPALGSSRFFEWNRKLTFLTCELTILYLPW